MRIRSSIPWCLLHDDAKYEDMVNILDELDLIERSWNAQIAEELGIKLDDLVNKAEFRHRKFSYRYAIGDWEAKDNKVIDEAIKKAEQEGKL